VSDLPTRRLTLRPGASAAGQRLDRYLVEQIPDLSRSRLHALIQDGQVTLDGHPARPADKVNPGDEIEIAIPPPAATELIAESIPLDLIYEDADLVVVNKPAGLVVHPAPGHTSGTLVNALLSRIPDLAGIGGELRPGIVHRLDKDTSGLIVVAKNERAQRLLAAQLRDRQMDKRYLALVDGAPNTETGTVEAPIARDPRHPQRMGVVPGGRVAVTHFRVLERFHRHTLLECKPVTGRTHQIRVHLAAIGCPVAADATYGRKTPTLPLARHFLHAARLTFRLPSGDSRTFEAPLPGDLQATLEVLSGQARE
jgi:23S rRNA pseudouridine1911/1915/1917 synthase